jgi:hypothetical protein
VHINPSLYLASIGCALMAAELNCSISLKGLRINAIVSVSISNEVVGHFVEEAQVLLGIVAILLVFIEVS